MDTLSTREAAQVLGINCPATIKNWLEGGTFPGAFQTPGGAWRFRTSNVVQARDRMREIRARNAAGDHEPRWADNPEDPPLL